MAQSVHRHNSIERSDSSHFITELIFEDPEATSVQNVKHSLSEKEGIPSRQRRLTFPFSPSKSAEAARYNSFSDQIRNELHLWQAIVYTNGKALGRLVQPSFTFSTPQESIQSYEFTFDTFYYAKKVPGQSSDSTALCFPIDTTFVTSDYTIQLFGRCGSASFALPFRYRVSGREAATKVSLQQQKREYIEKHEKVRRKKENKDAPVIPVQDIAISCGSGFESCLAVFSIRESPATLISLVLSFIVLTPPAPPKGDLHEKPSSENKEDMEAVLHSSAANATDPKTKDFNHTCKENSMGKVNVNRGKKPKKKTKKVIKNGPGGGGGSYDRIGSIPHSHDYTAVPSNRMPSNRAVSESLPEQSHQMNVVDKILQSITMRGVSGSATTAVDVFEKQSVDSPRLPDGETSRDLSSPEHGGHLSPTRTESESGGPPDPDTRRTGDDMKKQKDLTFAFNDFEVEDVYIRRNRSVGSLVRSGSGVLPASSGADAMAATPSAAPPSMQTTEHLTPNKPAEKQGWRCAPRIPSSPATSPHRLNFRSASGLLQSNGDGRNAVEDTSAVMPPTNGQTRFASAIYPSATAGDLVEHHPPGSDIEQGHQQRAAFQALLQMGPTHQPMTNLTHQMAAHAVHQTNMGSLQMPVVGHPPPAMPHLFAMTPPQQVLQGHHLALGSVPSLASLYGLHLGALLSQDAQLRGVAPDPMRREEFRKHKDDIHENTACFYMKPTNDLDRFLTEVTPMLQLDPTLEPQKALDQLALEDVWKFYYDCSMLGKEIPLHGSAAGKENHCGPCTAHYLPYLSGIQIFTPEDIPHVRDNIFLCDVDGWPSFMRMQYEQFEVNPPWFRLPLYDMMDELSTHVPELKELKLKDLHPASWFCVAWYPLYRIPDAPLGTRFLTFHNFHPMLHSATAVGQGGKVPLAVYGLEWYNMLDELWLDNIKVAKTIRSPSPSKPNDNGRYEGVSGAEVYSPEQQHWMLRIKELRQTAKTFARGLTFRRSTPHGIADANTHHHDFEYFYERN